MPTTEYCYVPTGELQGDDKPMPNRGTGTGLTGHRNMLDGHGIGQSDTNREVGIRGATRSDPMDQDKASNPN